MFRLNKILIIYLEVQKNDVMISIIVPVYNIEKELRYCVDSILAQTYKDFELLLIDDGSTDMSGVLCDDYTMKDERCKVIHQINKGLSEARNTGLNNCKGEYIMFIDGDDFVHPDLLKVLYLSLVSGNYDFSMALHEIVYSSTLKIFVQQPDYNRYVVTKNNYFFSMYNNKIYKNDICTLIDYHVVWAKLFKREIFENIRFRNVVSEDFEIMNRICMKMNSAILVGGNMYYYRQRENSLIHTNVLKQKIYKVNTYLKCLGDIPSKNIEYRSICLQRIYWSVININGEINSIMLSDYKKVSMRVLRNTFFELLLNKKIPIKLKLILPVLICKYLIK